jgi:hypothetical protein
MKRVLLWLVCWACHAHTGDFCPALAALVGPVKKNFPIIHYFNSFVPIAQQAGQAAVLGRLMVRMCLWSYRLQSELMEKSRQFPQIHILNGHCDHKAFCVVTNVFCIQAKHLLQSKEA